MDDHRFFKDIMHCREPVARVRRLRSKAIICIEDVEAFSILLKQEFPALTYFFANYKTGTPTPSKFSADVPIVLFPSMHAAILASIEIEKERPTYNGPDFNRPDVIARWPWPDELASGDPERLIGHREFPSDTYDLANQYRALGRWFMLHYPSKGYPHPRVPASPELEWKLDAVRLPDRQYQPFQILDAARSEFFTLYDLNDEETMRFAKRTHALWRRVSTNQVGHYDPITSRKVDPPGWDGKYPWHVGKRALAGALVKPPRYAGFAPRSMPNGDPLMLGPRKKSAG